MYDGIPLCSGRGRREREKGGGREMRGGRKGGTRGHYEVREFGAKSGHIPHP